MLRRLFLKWFGGAAAATAVVAGPKVAEAMRPDETLETEAMVFNSKTIPRHIIGVGVSEDHLSLLGFNLDKLTRKQLLRVDEVLKASGCVPADAVLEMVFPAVPQQLALIFRYWHKSYPLIRSFDCITTEGADYVKLGRFFKRG